MGTRLVVMSVVLTLVLTIGGCTLTPPVPTSMPSPVPVTTPAPAPALTLVPTLTLEPTQVPRLVPTSDAGVEAGLVDQTWISPAMVEIGNFRPGARAEWFVRIHNGGDVAATFLVSYRVPVSTKEGYAKAPPEVKDWVIIADATPVLESKETKEVLVVVAMPKEAELTSKKWEFWVSVIKQGQGMIQTEMCSRWLVNMR